ncbi:MAG: ABC transporter ATP-binding protein/permease [Lachnospiraceae bacterium]|nr:ABC transporter ATP-binding protein/permease [Lachnospiraceae bacterium]
MGKQFNESKDNPLHKEYGVLSNTVYIIRKCKQYSPVAIGMALIGIVCNSTMSYYMGFFGKFVIDVVGGDLDYQGKVTRLLWIVGIGALFGAILSMGSVWVGSKLWARYIYVRTNVITERIEKALGIRYEFLERAETLDIHERACQAVSGNNNGVEGMMRLLETLAVNFVTVIVTFVAVLVLDIRLVLVLIVLAIIQYIYHRFCIRYDKKNVWDKLGKTWRQINYMERVTQDFDYAKDIRLFSLQDFLLDKQEKIFKNRWKKFDLHQNIWLSHAAVVNVALLIGKAVIYGTLFWAVVNKDMTVGNFTLFFSLSMSFSQSLVEFLRRFGDYGRASLEVDDFRSFMDLSDDEGVEFENIPESSSYVIEFKDVSYKYPEADEYALKHLNLKIDASEKLAVVGINGAGKTTMIKLLLKLYQPTEGSILLNGKDIKNYRREDYYKLFAPVFQDVEIFAFPMAENVSMKGMDDTDVNKAIECVVEAGLKDKLESLPKGIKTELLKIVDDEGVDMSGGERQKLALARALYKNAPIVVLDEPTSALDAIAEQRLYESFDKMIGNKSAVYISHRLASTRFCDKIAMFKSGEMIEYGTHDELVALDGEYARMFELQAQYYQEESENDMGKEAMANA